MKGRSLRHITHTHPPRVTPRVTRRVTRSSTLRRRVHDALGGLGLISLIALSGACSATDRPRAEAADLPGAATSFEPADVAADPQTTAAPVVSTEVTASLPSVAGTEPSAVTTAAPAPATVVETLPVPEAPPPARANEPYIELGRIQIPKIGIDTTLLQGISLNTLDLGPGHWPGTALPGGVGNTVIAGHRTSHNKVFRNIDQLVPGDEVIFSTSEGEFVYVVRETTVVKPDAMYIVEQTFDSTATLFACHPPGSTRERIVVHLDLSPNQPDSPSV